MDIGCNEGMVTLAIATKFGTRRMTGVDIDRVLISKAATNLAQMRTRLTQQLHVRDRIGRCVGCLQIRLGKQGVGRVAGDCAGFVGWRGLVELECTTMRRVAVLRRLRAKLGGAYKLCIKQ